MAYFHINLVLLFAGNKWKRHERDNWAAYHPLYLSSHKLTLLNLNVLKIENIPLLTGWNWDSSYRVKMLLWTRQSIAGVCHKWARHLRQLGRKVIVESKPLARVKLVSWLEQVPGGVLHG
jgi:hypothetical protein